MSDSSKCSPKEEQKQDPPKIKEIATATEVEKEAAAAAAAAAFSSGKPIQDATQQSDWDAESDSVTNPFFCSPRE